MKAVGAVMVAALLVAAEWFLSVSTPLGTIVPIAVHVFVILIVLVYIALALDQIRERLDVLIRIGGGEVPSAIPEPVLGPPEELDRASFKKF